MVKVERIVVAEVEKVVASDTCLCHTIGLTHMMHYWVPRPFFGINILIGVLSCGRLFLTRLIASILFVCNLRHSATFLLLYHPFCLLLFQLCPFGRWSLLYLSVFFMLVMVARRLVCDLPLGSILLLLVVATIWIGMKLWFTLVLTLATSHRLLARPLHSFVTAPLKVVAVMLGFSLPFLYRLILHQYVLQ